MLTFEMRNIAAVDRQCTVVCKGVVQNDLDNSHSDLVEAGRCTVAEDLACSVTVNRKAAP